MATTEDLDDVLDEFYSAMDAELWAGNFSDIDSRLAGLGGDDVSVDIGLAWLVTTLPAAHHLPSRDGFRGRFMEGLIRRGEYEDGLLDGL